MSAPSPLERLRAAHQARQRARVHDVPLWEDGQLVARVGPISDPEAGAAAVRLAAGLPHGVGVSDEEAAMIVAAATIGLYSPDDAGVLEQIMTDAGAPLLFDHAYGAATGQPDINTPVGAVLSAMTEGEPPVVNSARLLLVATEIAGWSLGDDDDATELTVSGS